MCQTMTQSNFNYVPVTKCLPDKKYEQNPNLYKVTWLSLRFKEAYCILVKKTELFSIESKLSQSVKKNRKRSQISKHNIFKRNRKGSA